MNNYTCSKRSKHIMVYVRSVGSKAIWIVVFRKLYIMQETIFLARFLQSAKLSPIFVMRETMTLIVQFRRGSAKWKGVESR